VKLPQRISEVTLDREVYNRPYPPLGFYGFAEHELGNGDVFGLYWPFGNEHRDPVVIETSHDDWTLNPKFSSIDAFLLKASKVDEFEWVDEPLLTEDPLSPSACLREAKSCISKNDYETAVGLLDICLKVLPEFRAAIISRCAQYRLSGDSDNAIRAALRAIISPPSFGGDLASLVRWLASLSECPSDLQEDPLWKNRRKLTMRFGGLKQNDDYIILRNAIDQYVMQGKKMEAILLMQTYGELMFRETISFQERYGYNISEHLSRQRTMTKNLGFSREIPMES